MVKLNLKKELKPFYSASAKQVSVVQVPPMSFLVIDGRGDPNMSNDYAYAVEALFAVSYALKLMVKKGPWKVDYTAMPLETLYWVEDMTQFSLAHKENWEWTTMIMQPEQVTPALLDEACIQLEEKKGFLALSVIRLEEYAEGHAAQILHIGPYAEETPAVEKLHTFIQAEGGRLTGKHHEIYLSNPKRSAPDRLRTIIRQPFA